ncbi:MAG: AMP-binding protein [Paracoccaceae bacterium]
MTLRPNDVSPQTAMSLDDAVAKITSENPVFELTQATIRGVTYPVFKNVATDLGQMLRNAKPAHDNGQAEYLIFGSERYAYDAFLTRVEAVANQLKTRFDVGTGTRVALAMANCPEMLIAKMAIVSLGGVVVFLNAWWTQEELVYPIEDSAVRIVFADEKRLERLLPLKDTHDLHLISVRCDGGDARFSDLLAHPARAVIWPEIDPDSDFAVMYSSGTTGHPKGVVLTHRGAINAVYSWLMQLSILPLTNPQPASDTALPRPCGMIITPLFHVTASHPAFLVSIPAGAKLVLMARWDADEAVRLIDREKVTRVIGVPTQTADIMDAAKRLGSELKSLSVLGSGGAKRPPAQVSELNDALPNTQIGTGWGMTETNAIGIGAIGDEYVSHPASAGRLYPPIQQLEFRDPNGLPVPQGEIGEITVKSACNMREYLNKPEATQGTLQDGWLRTGDLGFIDENGVVTIVDRIKNIIIRGGENIACLDVEAALHGHPAVLEACSFAVPHSRLGEVVGAAVLLRQGHDATAGEIMGYLRERIAHFKVPENIWMYETTLPRGATDKLDRRGIQQHCIGQLPQTSSE